MCARIINDETFVNITPIPIHYFKYRAVLMAVAWCMNGLLYLQVNVYDPTTLNVDLYECLCNILDQLL